MKPADEPTMVEAVSCEVPGEIGGVPVIFVVRLYLDEDRIRAIRSVRVLGPGRKPFPVVTDGKMLLSDLRAIP